MCFAPTPLHIPHKYWAREYITLPTNATEKEKQSVVSKWWTNYLTVERWLNGVKGSEGEADAKGAFTLPHQYFSAVNAKDNYQRIESYANDLFEPGRIKRCSVQDEAEKYTLQIPYPSWALDVINNTSQEHNNWTVIERWAERIVARWRDCTCADEFEYTEITYTAPE